jgi:hypothetical protein
MEMEVGAVGCRTPVTVPLAQPVNAKARGLLGGAQPGFLGGVEEWQVWGLDLDPFAKEVLSALSPGEYSSRCSEYGAEAGKGSGTGSLKDAS